MTMTWREDHSLTLGPCLLSFSHLYIKKYSSSDSAWPFLVPGLYTLRCGDPGSQVGLGPVFLLLPLSLSPFLDLLNHPSSLSTFPTYQVPCPQVARSSFLLWPLSPLAHATLPWVCAGSVSSNPYMLGHCFPKGHYATSPLAGWGGRSLLLASGEWRQLHRVQWPHSRGWSCPRAEHWWVC